MRTLFDQSAKQIGTHEVRPKGVSRRRRRINPALSANKSGIRLVSNRRLSNAFFFPELSSH
jgi:hypothetical protein